MDEIRVGIVGFGFMGHEHLNMLQRLDGYRVVAVADRVPERLTDAPEGIRVYHSADELFADEEIDVVILSVNNNQHLPLTKAAAKAGKDIICEKPAAMTVAEFDEMVSVTKENDVRFTVHQQRRYDPDFCEIKAVYDQNLIGDVYTIKSQLYGFNGNVHEWHQYKSEGGGMLYDWGVHLIDQMLYMVNSKVTSVYANLRNIINFEVDDYFNIQIRFANGIVAEIEMGTYYLKDTERWFERHWFIGGNKGSAYTDGFTPTGKIVRTTDLLHNVTGAVAVTGAGPTRSFTHPKEGLVVTEKLPEVVAGHELFFENYRKARAGEGEFLVQIPQVRRVLALMEAVRESARIGRSVDFES